MSASGSRSHKERSHHSSSKSHHPSHKSKSERRHKESATFETIGASTPVSFLFVMVEHFIKDNATYRNPDRWGNILPPESLAAYDRSRETAGKVWRYYDGQIYEAEGYRWIRHPDGVGGIYPVSHGRLLGGPLIEYATYSVFNCGRFLPCLYAAADTSITIVDDPDTEDDVRWTQLAFDGQEGITSSDAPHGLVSRIGQAQRHLNVRKPSWMPDLVSSCHGSAPREDSPTSRGLGGCIAVILGLMALTQRPGRADQVFNFWSRGIWPGSVRREAADPHPAGPPRGVLVHVCLDDNLTEPEDERWASICNFELDGIMVLG